MAVLLKKPTQVYLRPEQLGALRWLARKRNVSVAELVRQGVDRVLADIPPEEDPLWNLVGTFDSGLGDLAEKHDEYIEKWIRDGGLPGPVAASPDAGDHQHGRRRSVYRDPPGGRASNGDR